MKIFIILALFSISLFSIEWDDADDFSRYRKDKNNFVILYFNSPSCSACKALDKKLKSKKINKLLKDFKKVKVTTSSKKGMELMEEFNITAYPTVYIVRGKEKRMLIRGVPNKLYKYLKQKLKPELKSIKLQPQKLKAPRVDMSNLRTSYTKISEFYIKNKDYASAIIYLEKLKKVDDDSLFASYELGKSKYYLAKELKGKENGVKKIELLKEAKENLNDAITRSRGYIGNKELSLVKDEINETLKTGNK